MLSLACSLSVPAHAQLGKASSEELARTGNGPGPVPGGVSAASLIKTSDTPPKADGRDFSGVWRIYRPPGATAAAAASQGVREQAKPAAGRLPDGILCMPMPGTTVGVDGPMRILQSDERIVWVAEQGHTVRRIYLDAPHPPTLADSHLGDAVAHFDGDTLVVETVGLRTLPPGGRMLERWRKSEDGSRIDMTIDDLDAQGRNIGAQRTQSITWRPGEEVLEWMCEDYNDDWLPGGSEFRDQVGK